MSIRSLIIPAISSQYTAEYIANSLWRENVAKVDKIVLIPTVGWDDDQHIFYTAYISIGEWCDSESAYYFIRHLKGYQGKVSFNHANDETWNIYCNLYPHEHIRNNDSFATVFDSSYFERINPDFIEYPEIQNDQFTYDIDSDSTNLESNSDIFSPINLNKKFLLTENLVNDCKQTTWIINNKVKNRKERHVTLEYFNFIKRYDLRSRFDQFKIRFNNNQYSLRPLITST